MNREKYLPIVIGLLWIFAMILVGSSSLITMSLNPLVNKSVLPSFCFLLFIFCFPVIVMHFGLKKLYLITMTLLSVGIIFSSIIFIVMLLFFATWGHLISVLTAIALLFFSFLLSIYWIIINLNTPIKNEHLLSLFTDIKRIE